MFATIERATVGYHRCMESFEARVKAIDWSRFHHAYGPAEDVPELLLAVANADREPDRFDEARDALWGNVYHQGTRWGVTSKTVPFFIELLTAGPSSLEAKSFLLEYLHHLAVGGPSALFPEHYPLAEVSDAAARAESGGYPQHVLDGDVFDEEDEAVQRAEADFFALWERDTFLAVERGVPAFVQFLAHDDVELALSAMALVSTFPRQRAVSEPGLWAVAWDMKALGRRGPALVALARLSLGAASAQVIEAARVVMDADDGTEGLFAACAEALGSPAPSEIVRRRLVNAPGEGECPFTGNLATLVALCVERAPVGDETASLGQLASLMKAAKGFDKLTILTRLLKVAFPAPLGASLSPLQRDVVQAIADHALWMDGMELANQNLILAEVGLPTSRAALRALVK